MEPTIERDREPPRRLRSRHQWRPRRVVLVSATLGAALALGLSLRSGGHMKPHVRPADVAIEAANGNYGAATALAHGRLNAAIWGDTPLAESDAAAMADTMRRLSETFAPASHWDSVALDAAEALESGNYGLAHTLLSELDWTING